ncbi:MAG: serine/threonine-protein kinase [Planctomycetota bacterium]
MGEKQVDSETFLKIVRKSGLIEESLIKKVEDRVLEKLDGRLPSSAKKLATVFQKDDLLTAWHCEKLLTGKYKGFFLGKYKLLGHIGTGGMSSVYLAEHQLMGDRRAIKVLPKSRVKDSTYLARFQLEAKAIASLNHRNIVRAFDIDNEGEVHYIVMEYVDGLDLQQIVKRDGPMDFSTTADAIAQSARGLQHAHERKVIHRDIKPANLLIDSTQTVKLLDMGLALISASEDESLTVANNENVLGTADYLAPEQALNSHKVDHRADIYGLGCTMYFLITGKPPFSDGTLAQRIARHQTEMPKPVRELRPDCPGELEGVCFKMIQKDPAYRYQTADAVAELLEKFASRVKPGAKVSIGLGDTAPEFQDDSSILKSGSSKTSTSSSSSRQRDPSGDTTSMSSGETLGDLPHQVEAKARNLSSSDSGRLVDMKKDELTDGSFLDLQLESGYRPDSKLGQNQQSSADSKSSGSSNGSSVQGNGTPSDVGVGQRSDVVYSSGVASARRRLDQSPTEGLSPKYLAIVGVALFAIAMGLGFVLARLTS